MTGPLVTKVCSVSDALLRAYRQRFLWLVLEVAIGERLPGRILHDEAPSRSSTDQGGGKRRGASACRAKRETPGAMFDIVSWAVAADGVGHAVRSP